MSSGSPAGDGAAGIGSAGPGRRSPAAAHEVAEVALAALRHHGVVIVSEHHGVDCRFANNTITTNGIRRQRRVTVVAVDPRPDGLAVGVASATGDGPGGAGLGAPGGAASWVDLVRAAEADAAAAAPADDAADLVAGPAAADYAEPPVPSGFPVLSGVTAGLDDAFGRAEADGLVLAGFAEHAVDTVYLASTTGLRLRHVQPAGRLQVVARTADGTASSWVGAGTTDFADVDVHAMVERVRQRLAWGGRRVEIPAGRYPTVLPPDAVADLVCMLGEACAGRDAEEGHSVFAAPGGGTRVGERLTPLPFDLRGDPAEPGLRCTPFVVAGGSGVDVSVFDNGLPIGRTAWIEGGVLNRLRYHRAGAARSQVPVAPPVDNLVLDLPGATASVDELVAQVDHGLLVTCLWYIREVDPATLLLTGLTRDGVYLVEGGEVSGAVNNFRFNESPLDVLARASVAGATRRALSREWNEWFPRTAMPSLLVPDFNMSSVSPAT
ncbi:MAG: metallopeptidase TldD-related protein [Actinomycetota bacterium]|nr:metallopeptidase TldD-related protein [Actinomycetota bacterium]